MTALPPIANVVRMDFQFETTAPFGGCRTFWLYNANSLTQAEVTAMAGHANAGWGANFNALVPAQIALVGVVMTDLASAQGFVGEDVTVQQGTRSGAQLPLDVAALINHKLTTRYRGGKPRTYLPLGTATDVLNGRTWTPAFVTSVTNSWRAFQNWMVSGSYGGATITNQACVHYYDSYTPNLNGSPWEERNVPAVDVAHASDNTEYIASSSCNAVFGSQRRRLRSTSF